MKVTDEQIIEAAKTSQTMAEGARTVGLHLSAFIFRAKKLGVHNPNQSRKGLPRKREETATRRIPLTEILDGKHPQYQTTLLKKKLISEGVFEDKCCLCGDDDVSRSRILDHINGINNDHRLSNLRLLCPNCNATLPTHTGRNKKNTGNRMDDEEIVTLILSGLNNHAILKQLNMSAYGANYKRLDRLRNTIELIRKML